MELHEQLRKYNRWRRGDERETMPDPKEFGELLDSAADRLEVLEREHAEFFECWHEERRKRERLEIAAKAVIERWETPLWKDAPATANYIYALRNAMTHNAELTGVA